jgi:hypothetical protein
VYAIFPFGIAIGENTLFPVTVTIHGLDELVSEYVYHVLASAYALISDQAFISIFSSVD